MRTVAFWCEWPALRYEERRSICPAKPARRKVWLLQNKANSRKHGKCGAPTAGDSCETIRMNSVDQSGSLSDRYIRSASRKSRPPSEIKQATRFSLAAPETVRQNAGSQIEDQS